MSDMGDDFRELRRNQAAKKQSNAKSNRSILDAHEVPYEVKNHGHHLILKHGKETINFWPSTGLWKSKDQSKRGIKSLMKHLGIDVKW